jgi:2-polyprenyl-6-methoxyphenol hydroxylase-like FAD-dependent oxidoreductase
MNCSISKATPTQKPLKIAILGGGIAGLSVYASLKKLNFEVQIFERSSSKRSSGMGFLLLENGIETLKEIGLDQSFNTISKKLDHYVSFGESDALGVSTPLEGVYAVKRNDILDMLLEDVDPEDLNYDMSYDHLVFDEDGSARAVVMTDGTNVEADVFIAADGVYSKVRSELFSNVSLEETDDHEIVCLLPKGLGQVPPGDDWVKYLDSTAGVNMGMFKLYNEELLWYLQFDKSKHGTPMEMDNGMEDFLKKIIQYLPDSFKDILLKSDPGKCFYWKTKRMDLLPRFHQNNVLLIGDAAHPLLTFTSQGVNSALRDALVLGDLFAEGVDDLEKIFTDFYLDRKDEIERYIKEGDERLEEFSSAKLQGLPLVC